MVNDPLVGQRFDSPPALEVGREGEYPISSTEDCRISRGQLQYLIQWTGYNSVTWEPAKFVDGVQAVGEFHQHYSMEPGPVENVLGGPRT